MNDDDMDEQNLLSCLNSINGKTMFVNLNNNNKRSSSSSQLENGNIKRRKADLTCVICEGHAYNYNFGQITCESCKNFFRRNASLLIENTKCRSSNNIRCNIRYDIKQKCQRCRLLKCLEFGMRKDLILTPEKKLSKEKCLEENRRMKYSRINNMHEENTEESSNINTYELNENDWLFILKYNLCSLILVRDSLTFDTTRELCYEDDVDDRYNSMSSNNKAFAERWKSLFMLCYSYELNRLLFNILHTLHSLIDNDPIIVQLLMLSMIFLKGSSCLERQEPILDDSKHVFYLHSKYTDLLFRYLIKQSSFNTAVIKMMHFVEVFMKYQRLSKDFHQEIKSKVDVDNISPFMKSFLHFA
ncbi:unnamed protein product [Adineta steineri]|uniref:Nuclear receptor domain-containing protein n=1 Tax=Adineta steineri TaxID=433720 RepID=A0A819YRP4_9BILA|nr:unnamed protein product [Adineta steineri]